MIFSKYVLVVFAILLVFSCKQNKKYHDVVEKKEFVAQTDAVADILEFQAALNTEFKDPEASPLPDRFRKNFESLDFFEPDTNFRVIGELMRTPEAIPFLMPTTSGEKSKEVVYGVVSFTINGKKLQLEIYQNKELMQKEGFEDYLFLPFSDKTNGEETYAGGRYIDLRIPDTNTILIDFNKAYNPYCAYNKKYSCPIVPNVNTLDIKITAGVKDFKKGEK